MLDLALPGRAMHSAAAPDSRSLCTLPVYGRAAHMFGSVRKSCPRWTPRPLQIILVHSGWVRYSRPCELCCSCTWNA